jgi:hypothetical protein
MLNWHENLKKKEVMEQIGRPLSETPKKDPKCDHNIP